MSAFCFRFMLLATAPIAIVTQQWCTYSNQTDVQSEHDPTKVMEIKNITTEVLCQSEAIGKGARAYTWCDAHCIREYAFMCTLRIDGVWSLLRQTDHHAGFRAAAGAPCPPPAPPPAPPTPTPAPGPAPPRPPCSLNGALDAHNTCMCDPGWIGLTCGQLNLKPAPGLRQQVAPESAMHTLNNSMFNSTWGISVIGPLGSEGVYHGYMTEIANHCPLGDYGSASQVVHMTAPSPLGPWTRQGVALAGFAHNPQAIVAPNGTVLLFHIGSALPAGCLRDCPGGGAPLPLPSHCPTSLSHSISVAVADSVDAPFQRYPYILSKLNARLTNPSAMLLPNGTIMLVGRRSTSNILPAFVADVKHPEGPWTAVDATVVLPPDAVYEEDPFLYRGRRGYHIITHRAVKTTIATAQDGGGGGGGAVSTREDTGTTLKEAGSRGYPPLGDQYCGGGHLFSPDLRTWWYGEAVYGQSDSADAQCMITFSGNIRTHLTSRERPTIFEDVKGGGRYLFTGASANVSMYVHSFTLVQQIGLD